MRNTNCCLNFHLGRDHMSVDLELLTTARNYAVKVETEFKKARVEWRQRFENLDEELQNLYREKEELKAWIQDLKKQIEKQEYTIELYQKRAGEI